MVYIKIFQRFNPLTAKLFNLNFHPLEVVSHWRDPQLQVSENYSDLTKWRSTLFKSCWLVPHFFLTIFKMWYLMCWEKMKTRIYVAPAVKGLSAQHCTNAIQMFCVCCDQLYIQHWEKTLLIICTYVYMSVIPTPVNTEHLYLPSYNVGPTLKTLGRRCTNVIPMLCACCLLDMLSAIVI